MLFMSSLEKKIERNKVQPIPILDQRPCRPIPCFTYEDNKKKKTISHIHNKNIKKKDQKQTFICSIRALN